MRKVWGLLVVVTLLVLGASLALAQGDEPEPLVETVTAVVDGETRTLTVTFVPTGVLSVVVGPAPMTETFAITAHAWLEDLFTSLGDLQPNDTDGTKKINAKLDEFLEVTETTPYPARYTPFVRQFRFAVHTCREWVNFHETVTKDDQGAIFVIAPYMTLQSACKNRYQEAYVEMERIKYAGD